MVHYLGHTGRVRYSYRTCLVWMTRGQRLVFKCLEGREFRHASGVLAPHKLQLIYLVFKYVEGREFRREPGVPTVGSPGILREFRGLTTSL